LNPAAVENLRPISYAAGALAGSAFVAVTQILATGAALDTPLYIALTLFAATIPFQFFIAFTPVIEPPLRKSHPTIFYFYWSIYPFTTPVIFLGFVAVFCHFACWLGALFFITSLAACLAFWYCAVKYFGQPHAEK
jgi:energy-converting hydrogenase Eha subunit A